MLDGGSGLPRLVRVEDLRGDLHCHTSHPTASPTIEEMAHAARALGYEYLAITDHSASHGFGDDVSPERLEEQIERIHAANLAIDGIELLAGSEVNILPDGRLDYDDELLARLDWVIASVHSSFRMGEREMTERIVAAIEHPYVDAIGHLTGRKIEARPPYAVDVERVIEAARAPARCSRSTPAPTAATSTTSTRARRRTPACGSSSTPTRIASARSRARAARGSPPRGGRGSPPTRSPTRVRGRSSRRCANGQTRADRSPPQGVTHARRRRRAAHVNRRGRRLAGCRRRQPSSAGSTRSCTVASKAAWR